VTYRSDPLSSLSAGHRLSIRFVHIRPPSWDGAGSLDKWDALDTVLLSVRHHSGDTMWADGSAVLIGPATALGAAHVFAPMIDAIREGQVSLALSMTPRGGVLWRVREIVFSDITDVAILNLAPASDIPPELFAATLTSRTPQVGERVIVAGALGSRGAIGDSHRFELRVGVGTVGEVFIGGRDRSMPQPCVEVRCLTVGGMSGGPAFDERGNLLGILTSSLSSREYTDGPSYVSLWWPVLCYDINQQHLVDLSLPTNLAEMERAGVVSIDRPEKLRIENGGVRISHWSND